MYSSSLELYIASRGSGIDIGGEGTSTRLAGGEGASTRLVRGGGVRESNTRSRETNIES